MQQNENKPIRGTAYYRIVFKLFGFFWVLFKTPWSSGLKLTHSFESKEEYKAWTKVNP